MNYLRLKSVCRCSYLVAFICFYSIIAVEGQGDWSSGGLPGPALINGTATPILSFHSIYDSAQLTFQAKIEAYLIPPTNNTNSTLQDGIIYTNASNIGSHPLSLEISFINSHGAKSIIETVILNQTDFLFTWTYNPHSVGFLGTGLQANVLAIPYGDNVYYNISSATIYFAQTSLMVASFGNTWEYCPGFRAFFFDLPEDRYAYNVTITSDIGLPQTFTGMTVYKYNSDTSNNTKYDSQVPDWIMISSKTGTTIENLKFGGRYWIIANCHNETAYGFIVVVKNYQTCTVKCFMHGTCINQKPPVCSCSTWYDGEDCTQLYRGDYALIVMAVILAVLVLGCGIFRAVKWSRRNKQIERYSEYNSESDDGIISSKGKRRVDRQPLLSPGYDD